MRCGQCGEQIPAGAHFCGQCGAPADSPVPSLVGQTIANRYRLIRQVGEGGMGTVYEAEQTLGSSVRAVAVKVLRPEWSHDPSVKARFHREAATVARLEHFNTVRIYDFGATESGTLYIVMEFLHGRSLQSVLDEHGPFPAERVLHLVRQAAASLDEAHRLGIVHRDLKPDNFLLLDTYASQKDVVKLVDFGIAKGEATPGASTTKLTEFGAFVGTPGYMSPEQFIGGGATPQSDIYSLALTTYQMLAGRLPFEAETVMQWAQHHLNTTPPPLEPENAAGPIPEAMRAAVARALSKNPAQRQASAVDFARELAGELIDAAVRSTAKSPSVAPPVASRADGAASPGSAALVASSGSAAGSAAAGSAGAPTSQRAAEPSRLPGAQRPSEPAPPPPAPGAPEPDSAAGGAELSARAPQPAEPAPKPPSAPAATAASPAFSPAAAPASNSMRTAPMAQMPDLQAAANNPWGTPTTQPMAQQAKAPSYAPARFSQPPPVQPRRSNTGRLIALAIIIPFAGVAAVAGFFALQGYRVFPWQTSSGPDIAPPPLVTTEPGSAPAPTEPPPAPPEPEPDPEPARPSAAPPRPSTPRPPASNPPSTSPPATSPPATSPGTPTTPSLPPGVPGLPLPGSGGAPAQTPGQTQPGQSPSTSPIPGLPWNLPTAGACERCLSALQGGGNYTVVTAVGEQLLCEDRAARERCEAQIIEQAPIVAERAARSGDCPAALATVAAAMNVRVSQDKFKEVQARCGLR